MSNSEKKDNSSLIWGIIIVVIIGLWLLNSSNKASSNEEVDYTDYSTNSTSVQTIQKPEVTPELRFNGYTCTVDCSGHEAGYNWAEEKGIDDTSDCGGNSNSFIEGCESYVEENSDDDSDYSE